MHCSADFSKAVIQLTDFETEHISISGWELMDRNVVLEFM